MSTTTMTETAMVPEYVSSEVAVNALLQMVCGNGTTVTARQRLGVELLVGGTLDGIPDQRFAKLLTELQAEASFNQNLACSIQQFDDGTDFLDLTDLGPDDEEEVCCCGHSESQHVDVFGSCAVEICHCNQMIPAPQSATRSSPR